MGQYSTSMYQYVPVISVEWARFECIDLLNCLWMTRCIPSCRYEVRIVPENTREIRGHCIPRWWRMAEGPVNNIQASKRSTNKTVSDRDPCSKFITSFSGYYIGSGMVWPIVCNSFHKLEHDSCTEGNNKEQDLEHDFCTEENIKEHDLEHGFCTEGNTKTPRFRARFLHGGEHQNTRI